MLTAAALPARPRAHARRFIDAAAAPTRVRTHAVAPRMHVSSRVRGVRGMRVSASVGDAAGAALGSILRTAPLLDVDALLQRPSLAFCRTPHGSETVRALVDMHLGLIRRWAGTATSSADGAPIDVPSPEWRDLLATYVFSAARYGVFLAKAERRFALHASMLDTGDAGGGALEPSAFLRYMFEIDQTIVMDMLEPSPALAAALRWAVAHAVGALPSVPPRVHAPEYPTSGWLAAGAAAGAGTLARLRSAVAPRDGGIAPQPGDAQLQLAMSISEPLARQLILWVLLVAFDAQAGARCVGDACIDDADAAPQ